MEPLVVKFSDIVPMGKWETGERESDNVTLVKLADYFAVTTDYLFERPFAIILYTPTAKLNPIDGVRYAMELALNRPINQKSSHSL